MGVQVVQWTKHSLLTARTGVWSLWSTGVVCERVWFIYKINYYIPVVQFQVFLWLVWCVTNKLLHTDNLKVQVKGEWMTSKSSRSCIHQMPMKVIDWGQAKDFVFSKTSFLWVVYYIERLYFKETKYAAILASKH